jgi:phosphate transport system protein
MPTQGHTLKRFDDELDELKAKVLSLGGLVEKAIAGATQSLMAGDLGLAQQTIERDMAINALEVQCDELTSRMLVRRQPAAGDLRFIVSTIKVVTDLERMGDLAVGIAEGTMRLEATPVKPVRALAVMSEKVQSQVAAALDALSRGDIELAFKVIEDDAAVDDMYHSLYREILTYMLENAQRISGYIILSNTAKNLERIGDHATNICEMVIYTIRGHDIRHVDHDAAAALLRDEEAGRAS